MPDHCPTTSLPQTAEPRGGASRALATARTVTVSVGADWSVGGLDALGSTMARRDIDLCTALCIFFAGEPQRFNYMPKRDVPVAYRATVRLLDNICQRVNSGFYLPHPGVPCRSGSALETWLGYQRSDAKEGRRGRWTFNERVLVPVLDLSWCSAPDSIRPRTTAVSVWRALLAPLRGLYVDRDILKYKPGRSDKP